MMLAIVWSVTAAATAVSGGGLSAGRITVSGHVPSTCRVSAATFAADTELKAVSAPHCTLPASISVVTSTVQSGDSKLILVSVTPR
jgi:hypothetical protein